MAIVTLNLAEVNQEADVRPRACPHCGSSLLQGWGKVRKPLRDPQLDEVKVRRFRCCDCGRTFRHYPDGVVSGRFNSSAGFSTSFSNSRLSIQPSLAAKQVLTCLNLIMAGKSTVKRS